MKGAIAEFSFACTVALSVCVLVVFSLSAWALPLEGFSSPLVISCSEDQRECGGTLRVAGSLGGHTGISIIKGIGGEVSLRVMRSSGKLKIESQGVEDLTVMFSWDGDSNPGTLSGAGLNCLDLTSHGAHAFILSKLSVAAECAADALVSDCPAFTVDSRVYDSRDPTGQRFSASTITRSDVGETNLAIPFSNFLRPGPRGSGSFTCAGAVSIALRFTGVDELNLELGAIYTNDEYGLNTPLPETPLPETPLPSGVLTGAPSTEIAASNPLPVATLTATNIPAINEQQLATPTIANSAVFETQHQISALEPVVDGAKSDGAQAGRAFSASESIKPKLPNDANFDGETVYGSVVGD